jgi:Tol biopolymer transport system component
MPRTRMPISKSLALLVVAIVVLALPAAAGATLVFTRNPFHPAVFAARDNGKGVHRVGAGYSPHVSPDGRSIVFFPGGKSSEMALVPASGGHPKTLMSGWREQFYFSFSPNSKLIAAERGHELGKRKLVVIDVATGKQSVIASGFFSGFSFSPDSTELVFSKSGRQFSSSGDLFRAGIGGGKPVAITHDHRSIDPLWGPSGRIVFDRVRNLKSDVGPKADLYLTNPDGRAVKRLTHTRIAPLLFGLSPVDWSANGGRLLAEFGGEDTSYGVTVNPRNGSERKLIPGDSEQGFLGTAISKDGSLVLGTTGGAEESTHHQVATVPYSGGKMKVIVANGYEPDWSR